LPRHILSVAEVEQVLNACDTTDPLGLRDRAMLETLYSTGMRRAEITSLRVDDVDFRHGTVFVRQGKGGKDRVVPIGERACRWVERYRYGVRTELVDVDDDGVLFLAKHGQGMQAKQLSVIVRGAITAAHLERFEGTHPNAACHLLRHACATHMLENGADIRYIQALLGHADLSTTEVYTRVSIAQLKAVHDRTHPARMPGLGRVQTGAVGLDPAGGADSAAADA
jgi:integrase/recombinase XerD